MKRRLSFVWPCGLSLRLFVIRDWRTIIYFPAAKTWVETISMNLQVLEVETNLRTVELFVQARSYCGPGVHRSVKSIMCSPKKKQKKNSHDGIDLVHTEH